MLPLTRYSRYSQYRHTLREYLGPQWPRIALLGALLRVTTLLSVANPQLVRLFIDAALAAGTQSAAQTEQTGRTLAWAALAFLAAGLVQQGLSALATYVGNDVGWAATNRLRSDLAAHCLGLDMTFHNARTPGELIERIDGDVSALANFFSAFTVRILGSVLLVIGVVVMLGREDWRVAALVLAFTLATFYALGKVREAATPRSREEREAGAQLFGFLEERLNGIDDIRANGAGDYTMRRYYEINRVLFHAGRRSWIYRGVMWGLTMAAFAVAQAVALGLGYRLFAAGEMTLGTVYLISHYTGMLIGPIERITNEMQDLQRAGAGLERVQELYTHRSVLSDGEGRALPRGPLGVEFDGVTFVYPDEAVEPVLHDVSFRVEPGKVLGLLGRTGSGKTTATRLLFRLYDPTQGAVRLGGVDVRRPHLDQLRERVAVVTQDVQLFSGSVRDNLTLFDPDVPDERILSVLEDLGLTEWQRALPNGLDTQLGSGGHGLSAGEAQLLAFTRAFLSDPSVVVLDEASSRLDLATEQLIERAVDKLLRDRTGVVIAHRLATVQRADQILVLEDGKVAELGRHSDLLAAGGVYATLMSAQRAESTVDVVLKTDGLDPDRRPANGAASEEATAGVRPAPIRAIPLLGLWARLLALVQPWTGTQIVVFLLGLAHAAAVVGLTVVSALLVRVAATGADLTPWLWGLGIMVPVVAFLTWAESWLAHDLAYRLLAEMRIDMYRALDPLAPGYLLRRRTGDLVSAVTSDVETI
ncbi:MAG TPA: ABC transporter transmembrane domain-containing protein, partial [Chloroflexota bacterium]|nr:ABC transporter transmembrane domain-containing protein [Chloroflexota bacterium]